MAIPKALSLTNFIDSNLSDYSPLVDPTTDIAADGIKALSAIVAQMSRMAAGAYVRFTGEDGYVSSHDAQWGNDASDVPVIVHDLTGQFTITWPATVTNELGETESVNLTRLKFIGVEGSSFYHVQASKVSGNEWQVFIMDDAGAATDTDSATIIVLELGKE